MRFVYLIRILIKLLEPLFLGGVSRDKREADHSLASVTTSDSKKVVIIPGSTLKGVVRRACSMIASRSLEKIHGYKSKERVGTNEELYIINEMFGSRDHMSHILFRTAYPKGETPLNVRTFLKIDSETGAAMRGALFSVEYVAPQTFFEAEIVVFDLEESHLGLLFSGLELAGELGIGGLKSRGFGKVEIKVKEVRIRDFTYYLDETNERVISGKELEEWIRQLKRKYLKSVGF